MPEWLEAHSTLVGLLVLASGLAGQWYWLRLKVDDILQWRKDMQQKVDEIEKDVQTMRVETAVERQRLTDVGRKVDDVQRTLEDLRSLLMQLLPQKGK
jgi:hypothetical protein